MKIKSTILNVLFIIILICLIYFFIYLNNSNFENFIGEDAGIILNPLSSDMSTSFQRPVEIVSENRGITASIVELPEIEIINDGSSINKPLQNTKSAYILTEYSKNIEKGKNKFIPEYLDGYYWIIVNGTPRYIYCIMDKNYFGGGWMLAMRSVYGSKNFSYDSSYFTKANTLNDDPEYISSIIPKSWQIDGGELKISSIGSNIYKKNLSPEKYDAKFHTFNFTKAEEWMAIFYIKLPSGRIITGGDLKKNNRGWVWYENNVKINRKKVSPLELFNYLDNDKPLNLTNLYARTAHYIGGKFMNGLNREDNKANYNNQIFSSLRPIRDNTDFYGFNCNNKNPLTNVRWGFNFNNMTDDTNNVISGIGTSYRTQNSDGSYNRSEKGFSAGNFEMTGKSSDSNFFDRPIDEILKNCSYAVEWYVREQKF